MKTAVVAAMKMELEALVGRLKNKKTVQKAGFRFHTGTLEGHEVVLLLSGIGKVNAGIGTALLIENFAPDAIINTGVAGAFQRGLKAGDIVLSTRVCHHDVDATPFGYKPGQLPGMPLDYEASSAMLAIAQSIPVRNESTRVLSGLIVSGDLFIHEESAARRIVETFPDALAGEMEAAGIAQACYLFGTPFLVVRSISDVIGDGKNKIEYEEFLPMAAGNSLSFVLDMLNKMEETP